VTDAPPHGLAGARGSHGHDSYPDGDPSGADPLHSCAVLAGMGVRVYTVPVVPEISRANNCSLAFMSAVAHLTGGRMVPLDSDRAPLLANITTASCVEAMSAKRTEQAVKRELIGGGAAEANRREEEQGDGGVVSRITAVLKAEGEIVRSLVVDAGGPGGGDASLVLPTLSDSGSLEPAIPTASPPAGTPPPIEPTDSVAEFNVLLKSPTLYEAAPALNDIAVAKMVQRKREARNLAREKAKRKEGREKETMEALQEEARMKQAAVEAEEEADEAEASAAVHVRKAKLVSWWPVIPVY
jgi:hypothetical protein